VPEPAAASSKKQAATCPVTIPSDRQAQPTKTETPVATFNYGNGGLRAELYWPRGTVTAGILPDGGQIATINKDGSIGLKVGWYRGLPGQLVIRGQRLDAPAPPLRANAGTVASYGREGFVPSILTFPTIGCWRVVGAVKHARLSFTVRVTKTKPASG
jgi:hypothetical protein